MRPAYLAVVAHGGAYALAECRPASGCIGFLNRVFGRRGAVGRGALRPGTVFRGVAAVVPAERACEAAPALVAGVGAHRNHGAWKPLAGTRWNGPVCWLGRTDTLSGASESGGEVGEDRDQFGRVASPRVVDPNRWREFHKRYFEEIGANHAAVDHLTDLLSAGKVTLLFGAHDTERNNAVALADYLAAHC